MLVGNGGGNGIKVMSGGQGGEVKKLEVKDERPKKAWPGGWRRCKIVEVGSEEELLAAVREVPKRGGAREDIKRGGTWRHTRDDGSKRDGTLDEPVVCVMHSVSVSSVCGVLSKAGSWSWACVCGPDTHAYNQLPDERNVRYRSFP